MFTVWVLFFLMNESTNNLHEYMNTVWIILGNFSCQIDQKIHQWFKIEVVTKYTFFAFLSTTYFSRDSFRPIKVLIKWTQIKYKNWKLFPLHFFLVSVFLVPFNLKKKDSWAIILDNLGRDNSDKISFKWDDSLRIFLLQNCWSWNFVSPC